MLGFAEVKGQAKRALEVAGGHNILVLLWQDSSAKLPTDGDWDTLGL